MWTRKTDFLVIGSGLAGLVYALKTAEIGKVLVCAKTDLSSTNTAMAQGGVAAVMAEDDSFSSHIQDTLTAGAGLCRESIVRMVVEQAPQRIQDLIQWGVQFDLRDSNGQAILNQSPGAQNLSLTREGGHSHRRILHIEDHTGRDIQAHLLQKALNHPNIEFLEQTLCLELITNHKIQANKVAPPRALGAYFLNRNTGQLGAVFARQTVLATGGAGKIYLYTSNWSGATGDGIAMAFRAGARVANMEFMQFHPTCLYHPKARNFLISEALRGEGGELKNSTGHAFMKGYHELGSLAPRDIVARSIDSEMKKSGTECVYLDMTHHSQEFLLKRFPLIYDQCLKHGIDMAKEPIPVVPAAHYLCGGVLTDDMGRTDVENLLVIGESACTGLHGANRLASNSLLECLVFGHNAAEHSRERMSSLSPELYDFNLSYGKESLTNDTKVIINHMWDEIRHLMWNYVGIVRSNSRLLRAQSRLRTLIAEIDQMYSQTQVSPDLIELRNIALVADLTVRCALKRKGSIGIHYNLDAPKLDPNDAVNDTIMSASDLYPLG